MSTQFRDIVISPDRGVSTDPTIRFTGADSLSSATIVLRVYNSGTDATLSFEGDVGQLLAITDSTFGPVFSVNDITGIPSIEVLDTGEIKLAQYSGFVNIPNSTNATSTGTGALRTLGGVGIARDVWVGGNVNIAGTLNAATLVGSVTTASQVAITNDTASATAHYLTFVSGTSGNLPIKVDSSALTFVPSTNNVGIGTTNPYTRLSIVSSANTEGISLFTSAYEASRQWGTRIWKNDVGAGIPLQIETQDATTWYNSIRIGHGQNNSHPSLTTFYTTHLATTGGNVGIATTSPGAPLQVRGSGAANTYRGVIRIDNTDTTNAWSGISFPDNATGADTNANNYYFIGRGGSISSRIFSIHMPTAGDYGSGSQPTFGVYSTGADPLFTVQSSTGNGYFKGTVGINTTDFSYTTGDNTRLIGAYTNNRLFVNGSIQLLGNNDAIVIGRGTATFLTDEELGFGWGGGWWMNDSTYLRVRNYKHLYNENTITGSRHQGFSTDYNQPSMFMPRWEDTNWAFGMSSNNSNTYWMQVQYNGANNNTRGFRVWDNNAGVARMSVADRITTHQNTFYRTFQNYTGSDNGPVKTWDGVLIAGSDYSSAATYTIIDTGVPQDSYMMGGFTIEWFENYASTNAKTTIKLGGYWNPESNGGFIGWEYTTSNPNVVPTIQVCRNNSTGNTAFVLTHFSSNYAIILARDLWLGYSGGDYNYGHGWAIRQQSDLTGYSNFDAVVARAAASASGINADTLDSVDSSQFLRSDVSDSWAASNGPLLIYTPNGASGATTSQVNNLQVFQQNANTDAFMSFHVSGDYGAHFGLDGTTNDLFYGGWSVGGVKHRVYHAGNTDLNLLREPVSIYKWSVSASGTQARRYVILRLYGTPNHWSNWQNIRIRIDSTSFTSGFVEYYLYGFYGMGNGNSWTLLVKDAGGVETNRYRVSLGPVTYAGFTSGGQNTYYQDVFVDIDFYMSANVTASFYGNGYQTSTPGAEIYSATQLFTSPGIGNITYSNDDKTSSYLFTNKIWNAGNDGAGSGLDADLLDGLELHTGRNNEANKVVRTDGSGYIQAGWINTTSGDLGNTLPDRVYMSNDGYIRYNTLNTAKAHLGNTAKYGNSRPNITSDTAYWVGAMGWSTTDLNSVFDWGCGFWDSWSSPGNQPSSATSHWTGLQSLHYTNNTTRYGWQMAMGAGDPNLFYVRGVWGGGFGSWYKINLLGLNQGGSNYASIYYDSDDTAYYADPNSISRFYGLAIRGDNSSTDSGNQIFFWGQGDSTTSAIGFKANGGEFPNPTGNGDGYNTYLTMDTDGRGWVFRRSPGGSDFNTSYTSGWILNNGIWQANSSMRAPIFYDSNNTGYYLDPNSTTALRTVGSWRADSSAWDGDFSGKIQYHSNHWYIQAADLFIYRNSGGSNVFTINQSGSASANADMRAPIFYDSNSTAYYADPASGSRFYDLTIQSTIAFPTSNGASQARGGPAYNIYQESGAWNYPYPDLNIAFHTGLSFGANPGYDGMRFYTDYDLSSRVMQVNGSSNYIYMDRWVNVAGNQGIYSGTNSAHFYPNNGDYGSWRIDGTRNGWHGIYFASGSTLMMNDGDGGIHRSGNGWRIYHSGNTLYARGDIVAYWSDRRLKQNIKPLDRGQGIDIIDKLVPSSFEWNAKANEIHEDIEEGQPEIALIAQEVQEILPNAVTENKAGRKAGKDSNIESYLTIKYDKITPFLIQAVKDLIAEVNDLKSEIKDLKEKLNNGAN